MSSYEIDNKTEARPEPTCTCGGNCNPEKAETANMQRGEGPSVKVLGPGCPKCQALERAAREALVELGMLTSIDHVTGFAEIAAYGVMSTPALVVDGKVVSYGRVLTKDDVVKILKAERG